MSPTTFITRWKNAGGTELANAQLFVVELCELLGLPRPEPASDDLRDNAYVFERRIRERLGDGSEAERRVDCYRRAAFVLEAKKLHAGTATRGFDEALMKARAQAEGYARALPASEGRPPFLVVVDVGRVIELYSEFSRSGATYVPYPDPRSHRIRIDDLAREDIRERLKNVWLDPDALDPAKVSAQATRAVAADLARIAKALEAAGHAPEAVAGFLTRCLFTFFAEDVGLLPAKAFETLLGDLAKAPAQFVPMLGELWEAMDVGRFSVAIRADVRRFNGKLFKRPAQGEMVLPLNRDQIEDLHACAQRRWNEVEPAIIGTLLERALDPRERHKLGAHYTPRAYVERLVLPTVIEPLRADWALAQATSLSLAKDGKADQAVATLRHFHHDLCQVRVLDPACGSGNFLYVTLEHLKRLEGEVLDQLAALTGGQQKLETEGLTVDPHQLLGIEVNPRAAALAELVLWIGYLQWHYRTRGGNAEPPLPVLKDYGNIVCRDAVLAWDKVDFVTDAHGVPVTRWDGRTMKRHPVTGEEVPDDRAQVPVERYKDARQATWPDADFVVGNPPFLGKGESMRTALGEGYLDALRAAWPAVPESADFVMYWWHHAANLTRQGALRRFGLITTNSIKQTFNRRVIAAALGGEPALQLAFAIPDHPWVDAADGAAVRIAMTVGCTPSGADGRRLEVLSEAVGVDDEIAVVLRERAGIVHADLSIGADVTKCGALKANQSITSMGVLLAGGGFLVNAAEAKELAEQIGPSAPEVIKQIRNGRDLTDGPRDLYVIDLYGRTERDVRDSYPAVYQRLVERVKPERDLNNRPSYRNRWWLFAEARPALRSMLKGLDGYLVTVETSKHRLFQFLEPWVLPEHRLIVFGVNDAGVLTVLSSRIHVMWANSAGGTLEDRPVYNKSRCFEPFPFPNLSAAQNPSPPGRGAGVRDAASEAAHSIGESSPSPKPLPGGEGLGATSSAGVALIDRIRHLGEAIDAHRKRQQAAHPGLTLTGLYNVLEQLRRGVALTAKEKAIHEQGLVSVLASLHDELDTAVLAAYGWSDLAPALVGKPGGTLPYPEADEAQTAAESELLSRLVALNAERAAEEARGLVRWLRPEFQDPARAAPQAQVVRVPEQVEAELDGGEEAKASLTPSRRSHAPAPGGRGEKGAKQAWPAELPAQMRALTELFASTRVPLSIDAIADRYSTRGKWKARLPELVGTLEAIGQIRSVGNGWVTAR
ncbi:MAG: hypothetical protein Q8M37_10985 [Nevskia sp.]|nr:hypothetical protein [Nevskia sp.]